MPSWMCRFQVRVQEGARGDTILQRKSCLVVPGKLVGWMMGCGQIKK